MRSFNLFIILVLAVSLCEVTPLVCTSTVANGITYDLTNLQRLGKITIVDQRSLNKGPINNTYVFSFCNVIDPPIPQCKETKGDNTEEKLIGPGLAFVYDKNNNCNHLSATNVTKDTIGWQFIDVQNPSVGVKLTYRDGDRAERFPRRLEINLYCSAIKRTIPKTTTVEITDGYHYSMSLRSEYACPIDCPLHNDIVCSGNGACGYNPEKKSAYCFCSEGYLGTACNKKDSMSWFSVNIILYILVGIIALMIIGFGVFVMWNKLRKIDSIMNKEAYQSLDAQFNQLGQLA